MRRDVVTVRADDDIWTLIRVFSEKGITGAPVLDEEGELVGVVSQTDVMRHLKEVSIASGGSDDFYNGEEIANRGLFRVKVTARELMSPEVITASENTSVGRLGRNMLRRRIHRIVIVKGRKIAGIVTTMDLLNIT